MIEMIVQGITGRGANNTNVTILPNDEMDTKYGSVTIKKGHVAHIWVPNSVVDQVNLRAGMTLLVEQVQQIGQPETHWENSEGDMVEKKRPTQRVRIGGSLDVREPEVESIKSLTVLSA
jgi:hypothetical protein